MSMSSQKIILGAVVAIVAVGIGAALWNSSINNPVSLTQKDICTTEFNNLYTRNKADLTQCSSTIRDGEFTRTEPAAKQNNVVLIFDASGSMAGTVQGVRKIDAAKEAVRDFVMKLTGTKVNVSVIVYGHRGDNSERNKALSCEGIEELYTFGEASGPKIEATLRGFEPTGWTPIADSLEEVASILAPYNSDAYDNSIVLISDGLETCGGDPVGVLEAIKRDGLSVTANVIGFDVTDTDSQSLRAIADVTGGNYFDVKDKADLELALKKHIAYMEKFDYRIRRVSEELEDITTATQQHFSCMENLEIERAHMILDIYADEMTSPSCAEKVDMLYSAQYELKKKALVESFDAMIEEFKQKGE